MGTLYKKLRFINSSGTTQTANIYTTAEECGSPKVMRIFADNVYGYVPLFYLGDARGTSGRVWIPSTSTTYTIGATGQPLYSSQAYTVAGVYTFTVPTGCLKLRITCIGGGGGGAVGQCGNKGSGSVIAYANNGGNSSCGGIVATGGSGALAAANDCDNTLILKDSSVITIDHYYCIAGSGGSNYGNGGTTATGDWESFSASIQGGAGKQLVSYNTVVSGGFGQGGMASANGNSYEDTGLASGGSGGFSSGTISVTAGQVIQVTVGGGGNGAVCGNESGGYDGVWSHYVRTEVDSEHGYDQDIYSTTYYSMGNVHNVDYSLTGANGSTGAVLIEWGGDIK